MGFGVFLVHPTMASVLLSASVERCLVSRMRDFSGGFLMHREVWIMECAVCSVIFEVKCEMFHAVWNMQCETCSVKCAVWNMQCRLKYAVQCENAVLCEMFSAVWNMQCNIKCAVQFEMCSAVWNVQCSVKFAVQCETCIVKYAVWNVQCNVKCAVQCSVQQCLCLSKGLAGRRGKDNSHTCYLVYCLLCSHLILYTASVQLSKHASYGTE